MKNIKSIPKKYWFVIGLAIVDMIFIGLGIGLQSVGLVWLGIVGMITNIVIYRQDKNKKEVK